MEVENNLIVWEFVIIAKLDNIAEKVPPEAVNLIEKRGNDMNENPKTTQSLTSCQCTPCKIDVPPLQPQQIEELQKMLTEDWKVIDNHHLEKDYTFKNFKQALDFVNKVGDLAESQGHHPDIFLSWGKVKLTIWTHKIKGLHRNDFILAAKADQLLTTP